MINYDAIKANLKDQEEVIKPAVDEEGQQNSKKEKSGTNEELETKDMLMILDQESNQQFDINEYWQNQVFAGDATNYYDKHSNKNFTTLSSKDRAGQNDMWDDFWLRKDRANSELIDAAAQGHISKTRDLLSPLNDPED